MFCNVIYILVDYKCKSGQTLTGISTVILDAFIENKMYIFIGAASRLKKSVVIQIQ